MSDLKLDECRLVFSGGSPAYSGFRVEFSRRLGPYPDSDMLEIVVPRRLTTEHELVAIGLISQIMGAMDGGNPPQRPAQTG